MFSHLVIPAEVGIYGCMDTGFRRDDKGMCRLAVSRRVQ